MAEPKHQHRWVTTSLQIRRYVEMGNGVFLLYKDYGNVVMGPVRECLVYESLCECYSIVHTGKPEPLQFDKKMAEPEHNNDAIFKAHTNHRLAVLEETRG